MIAKLRSLETKEVYKMLKTIGNVTLALLRGVRCTKCGSRNVWRNSWEPVDPAEIKDAAYYASGHSLAAVLGWKSAEGNYKKSGDDGTIYQTRDEAWVCCKCNADFIIRREVIIATDH